MLCAFDHMESSASSLLPRPGSSAAHSTPEILQRLFITTSNLSLSYSSFKLMHHVIQESPLAPSCLWHHFQICQTRVAFCNLPSLPFANVSLTL